MRDDYHPLPQPDEVPVREREDAMGAYLMMFAAVAAGLPLPVINLIASVIYFTMYKNSSRFVRFHSLQALLCQIFVSVLNSVLVFWAIRMLLARQWIYKDAFVAYGISLLVLNLAYLTINLVAAIRARKGRLFYFPVIGKIAYRNSFKVREEPRPAVNQPPVW